jgi:GTP cyclohydrolase II
MSVNIQGNDSAKTPCSYSHPSLLKANMSKKLPAANIRKSVIIDIDQGKSEFTTFSHLLDGKEHIAISFPAAMKVASLKENYVPLVRIHSECLTGDVFGSARCDCGDQLSSALQAMAQEGGYLLYLRQEGRGIGLYNKMDAYALQDEGHDTFKANLLLGLEEDQRKYDVAVQMLVALGVKKIKLLTNNPDKVEQLKQHGIEVVEVIPTKVFVKSQNQQYLLAKKNYAGHTINSSKLT